MTQSKMSSYGCLPLLVVILAVVATVTDAQTRCCAPDQLSADVVISGKLALTTVVDWKKKMAYENWLGNDGISYVLYDANNMVYYVRKTNGDCTKKSLVDWSRYYQCVPESAVHIRVPTEDNTVLDGWQYNYNPETTRLVVVKRTGCLPYRIQQSKNDHYHVAHFINVVGSVADPSVFNTDVTDCVDG